LKKLKKDKNNEKKDKEVKENLSESETSNIVIDEDESNKENTPTKVPSVPSDPSFQMETPGMNVKRKFFNSKAIVDTAALYDQDDGKSKTKTKTKVNSFPLGSPIANRLRSRLKIK